MAESSCEIVSIHAREVFDSRGLPTVEVEVTCAGSKTGRAIVPSGASTGKHESVELRDGDVARLEGKGVRRAVDFVNTEIAKALAHFDAADQRAIDLRLCELDGTENKSRLGANAILGVSLAAAHAAAEAQQLLLVEHLHQLWRSVPRTLGSIRPVGRHWPDLGGLVGDRLTLPLPMVNMISGGLHAGGNVDLQDVLILPVGASSFREALDWVVTVYRRLGRDLVAAGREGRLVGDEGGYGPRLKSNEEAVETVVRAIEAAGFQPGIDLAIGLDVASSHFFSGGEYRLASENGRTLSTEELIDLLADWVDRYPVVSIEDGLAEDEWEGWRQLTDRLGGRVQLIGDDLFVTNWERLSLGIRSGTGNSVLIKVNQIGTLWETLQTLRLAIDHGYRPVISARSGETEDATIADLAVATGAGQIKIGCVARSERLAKYNQLLRLEERLGSRAEYRGPSMLAQLQSSEERKLKGDAETRGSRRAGMWPHGDAPSENV
jgi:enolase